MQDGDIHLEGTFLHIFEIHGKVEVKIKKEI